MGIAPLNVPCMVLSWQHHPNLFTDSHDFDRSRLCIGARMGAHTPQSCHPFTTGRKGWHGAKTRRCSRYQQGSFHCSDIPPRTFFVCLRETVLMNITVFRLSGSRMTCSLVITSTSKSVLTLTMAWLLEGKHVQNTMFLLCRVVWSVSEAGCSATSRLGLHTVWHSGFESWHGRIRSCILYNWRKIIISCTITYF